MSQAVRRPWLVVASGKVQADAPSAADVKAALKAQGREKANAIAAERRKAPADAALPPDCVRRRSTDFNPDAQRELMLELAKDPEVVAGARKLMARREVWPPPQEALQTSRRRSAEEVDTPADHWTGALIMIS